VDLRCLCMSCPTLPRTFWAMCWAARASTRIGLAALAFGVFGLSSVPLEIQRRIVNDAIKNGAPVPSCGWRSPMPVSVCSEQG